MKIEYPLTQQELKAGATIHFKKKLGKQILVALVAIVVLLTLYNVYKGRTDLINIIPSFLTAFIVFILLIFTYPGRAAKPAFKGKPDVLPHTIIATEEGLDWETPMGNSTTNWSAYVDYLITPQGALLYPQKNYFYWIPVTATVTEGTWEEFTQLLEKKIQKSA